MSEDNRNIVPNVKVTMQDYRFDASDFLAGIIVHDLFVASIALMVLKLVGTIDWEWWQVLAPLWVPFAIALVIAFVKAFVDAIRKPA